MLAIVCLILFSVLIILIISYYIGMWESYKVPQDDIEDMKMSYNIPSPWSSSSNATNSDCQVITFVDKNPNIIPQPNIRSLNASIMSFDTKIKLPQTCVDDDQITAVKKAHVCNYGELQGIPISQYTGCRLINGGTTKVNGYYEEYYAICSFGGSSSNIQNTTSDNSNRCSGTIGLLTYNYTSSLKSATCIVEPDYKINRGNVDIPPIAFLKTTKNSTESNANCSINANYEGFPTQLFRLVRYSYDNEKRNFVLNNSGSWVSIVHRPTNTCIAPYTLSGTPLTANVVSLVRDSSAVLIDCSSFNNVWFYMTPSLNQPSDQIRNIEKPSDYSNSTKYPQFDKNNRDWDGKVWKDEALSALPQLIWVPDARVFSLLSTQDELWNYLVDTDNNIISLVPFRIVNKIPDYSAMSMVPFLTYSRSSTNTLPLRTDSNSLYNPNWKDFEGNYFRDKYNDKTSACYNKGTGNKPVISIATIYGPVSVRISTNSTCYTEYNNFKNEQYNNAVKKYQDRVIAEGGSFQYINISLMGLINNIT
jgi:hypothetical protein